MSEYSKPALEEVLEEKQEPPSSKQKKQTSKMGVDTHDYPAAKAIRGRFVQKDKEFFSRLNEQDYFFRKGVDNAIITGKAPRNAFPNWKNSLFIELSTQGNTHYKNINPTFRGGSYGEVTGASSTGVIAVEEAVFGKNSFPDATSLYADSATFKYGSLAELTNGAILDSQLEDVTLSGADFVTVKKTEMRDPDVVDESLDLGHNAARGIKRSRFAYVNTGSNFANGGDDIVFVGGRVGRESYANATNVFHYSHHDKDAVIVAPETGFLMFNYAPKVLRPEKSNSLILVNHLQGQDAYKNQFIQLNSKQFESVSDCFKGFFSQEEAPASMKVEDKETDIAYLARMLDEKLQKTDVELSEGQQAYWSRLVSQAK